MSGQDEGSKGVAWLKPRGAGSSIAVKGEAVADHKAGASAAGISGQHGKAQAPILGHVLLCLERCGCIHTDCQLPVLRDIFGVAAQELLCKSGKIELAQSCAGLRGISGHCDVPIRPGRQSGAFGQAETFPVQMMAIPRNGEISAKAVRTGDADLPVVGCCLNRQRGHIRG